MSALPSPTPGSAFTDFVFDLSEKLDSLGGPKQRYLSNVAAIKLLKQLEAECRPPGNLTSDEQQTLARYCGWGDTEVFNHSCIRKSHYEIEHCGNLKGLLTEAEITSLRASTLNSHYTRLDAIRAIYEAIERLGLAAWGKLRILEPAAGIGHFLGAMPAALANGAERVAIELDSVTARILARLYPTTRVFESGFEAVRLPKDYFDLIISNIPFANVPVHDPETKDRHLRECVRLLFRQEPVASQTRRGSCLHHFTLYAGQAEECRAPLPCPVRGASRCCSVAERGVQTECRNRSHHRCRPFA
jgi:hypothetical protein